MSPLTWNQFQTLRGLVEEIPWPPSVESLELTREIFLGEHPTASEMTWFRSGLDPRVVSAVEELIRFKGGGPLSRELLNASLRADLTHERCAHLLACSRRSVFTKVLDVEEKLSWEAVFDWACGEVELFIGSNPSRTELRKCETLLAANQTSDRCFQYSHSGALACGRGLSPRRNYPLRGLPYYLSR